MPEMRKFAIKMCESKQRKGKRYGEDYRLTPQVREGKSERKKEQEKEQTMVIKK